MSAPHTLRRRLREIRLAIDPQTRAQAEDAILRQVARYRRFRQAQRIAAYIGNAGEVDPMPLLERASRMHKTCYLPVLHPFLHNRLWFVRWRPGDPLRRNRYGIPEPVPHASRLIAARDLDLVLVPLLGFDADCHRLGMGGGFYDRSFAFVKRHASARRPFLLGLAHDAQRVDRLPAEPWDIGLDAIVSELAVYTRAVIVQ